MVAAVAILLLIAMSWRANRRLRTERRLPMQWSVSGAVNWTAPRCVALAFTPTLATAVLVPAVASSIFLGPRRAQEGYEVLTIVLIGLVFVGAHALHLWLVKKSMHRNV
jgi:hypothetical protein